MASSSESNSTDQEVKRRDEDVLGHVTLVTAIKDKYCSAPEPNYDQEVLHSMRAIKEFATSKRPGALPIQDVRSIILEKSQIHTSGLSEDLQSLCPSVRELHLGGNRIAQWDVVLTILESLPSLEYLDLNHNRDLSHTSLPPHLPSNHLPSSLRVLTLSCTRIPFDQTVRVLESLPSVSELHLSKNEYKDDNLQLNEYPQHNGLKTIHLASNNIKEWNSVETIGRLFPNLETLLISVNPLDNITPSGEKFKKLRNLNLNNTEVSSWDSVESLLTFPDLTDLSMWHVPIGSDLNDKERRFAVISRLPAIQSLNKSSVSESEREDAERWLIREYQEHPKRPSVYENLTERHGRLQPLVDVDLSPKKQVSLEFSYEGFERQREIHSIATEQTTKQLKCWVGQKLLQVSPSKLRMYYVDMEGNDVVYGSELMMFDTRPLYYYRMKDGDRIEIALKHQNK